MADPPVLSADPSGETPAEEWSVYEIHVPDGFNAELAKITILFGVGGDLNRHGVRSFFKGSTDTIVIMQGNLIT